MAICTVNGSSGFSCLWDRDAACRQQGGGGGGGSCQSQAGLRHSLLQQALEAAEMQSCCQVLPASSVP